MNQKKKLLIAVVAAWALALLYSGVWASQVNINGTGNGNDRALAVTVDGAGNPVAAGFTESAGTSQDFAVMKFDAGGSRRLGRAVEGTWVTVPAMATQRSGHTATRLNDGRVLIAGGSIFTRAELFDPETRTWAPTGAMSVSRTRHAATLLRDGRVLVVGGEIPLSIVKTAEIYDPSTGAWTDTGRTVFHHSSFGFIGAVQLTDERVLVVGSGGVEIFSPETDTWAATVPHLTVGASLTLLDDGRALFAGVAKVFDLEAWTLVPMQLVRLSHTATRLNDGPVLVSGGSRDSIGVSFAEIFVPRAEDVEDRWDVAESMTTRRALHAAALLPDGNVLVAGGFEVEPAVSCEFNESHNSSEQFNSGTGTWVSSGPMNVRRAVFTLTRVGDDDNPMVLAAGGVTTGACCDFGCFDTPTATAELFVPLPCAENCEGGP